MPYTPPTKFIQALPFVLPGGCDPTQTDIVTSIIYDVYGNKITNADIGSGVPFTFEPFSLDNQEISLLTNIVDNGDDTYTITCVRRLGATYPYTALVGPQRDHGGGTECVISNDPNLYKQLAAKNNKETITDTWIFTATPQSPVDAILNDDIPNYGQILAIVFGNVSTAVLKVPGIAGVKVVAGDSVFYDTVSQTWLLTDATNPALSLDKIIGIVQSATLAGNPILKGILIRGYDTNQVALTPGDIMYLSNTPGALSNTAGTNPVEVGEVSADGNLYVEPHFLSYPTKDQKDALGGVGSPPNSTNKYETFSDTTDGNTTDQSQLVQDISEAVGEADATTKHVLLAQSFIAGKSPIASIEFNKQADTGAFIGSVKISIVADVAGSPSGPDLASVTIANGPWLALSVGANIVSFVSPLVATTGVTYWIVITPSTNDNANYINIGANSAGGYADGVVKYFDTADGWTLIAVIDLYFRTITNTGGKLARFKTNGQLTVENTPILPTDATSKDYVDTHSSSAIEIFTTAEDMLKNDMSYPTGNNLIKRYRPLSPAASVAPTSSIQGVLSGYTYKALNIDTTHILFVGGGFSGTNVLGQATIAVVNNQGQIISNGGPTTYTLHQADMFDICKIDTDHYLLIWQDDNGGLATGIKARIINTAGGVITLGANVTIETTGNIADQVSCIAIDSSRVLITYRRDANSHQFAQVLSIAGNVISTNVAVDVDTTTSIKRSALALIDTNRVLMVYQAISGFGLLANASVLDIAGTVITVQSPTLLHDTAGDSSSFDFGMISIMTNKVILVSEQDNTLSCQAQVLTVSGNVVTANAPIACGSTFDTFVSAYIGLLRMSNTVFMANFLAGVGVNGNYLYEIDGSNNIHFIFNTSLATGGTGPTGLVIKTAPFVTYSSAANNIASIEKIVTWNQPAVIRLGVLNADKVSGAVDAEVVLRKRMLDNYTGLTVGEYFIDDDGQPTLQTSSATVQYGTAVNTTKMFIE